MIKFIFSSLMILVSIRNLNANCSEGTLQCNNDNKSVICDFLNGFSINESGDACEKISIDGCKIIGFINSSQKCLICQENFLYDSEKQNCVEIPSDKRIENCLLYNLNQDSYSCEKCDSKYVIEENECVAVSDENLIPNCLNYSKNDSIYNCSECSEGFFFNDDQDSCTEFTKIDNCLKHSDRQCETCENGYILNRAIPSQIELSSSLYMDLLSKNNNNFTFSQIKNNSVCQKSIIKNCSVLKSFKSCQTCNFGYFLNSEDLCEFFPEDPIEFCVVYENGTSCSECESGYWLDSSNPDNIDCKPFPEDPNCETFSKTSNNCTKCKPTHFLNLSDPIGCTAHTEIDNCESYFAIKNGCEICKTGYFRNTEEVNGCSSRSTINDCEEFTIDEDICEKCNENFILTIDGKACKEKRNGCLNYVIPQSSQNEVSCTQCQKNFYMKSSIECAERVLVNESTQEKCQSYVWNQDKCEKCESNYYLNEDQTTCTEINIPNCLIQEEFENKCDKCENLFYRNSDKDSCLEIDAKENCFESDGFMNKCVKCIVSKYHVSSNFDIEGICANSRKGFYDQNCLYNIFPTSSTICSGCNDEHTVFNTAFTQLDISSNCESLKPATDGECKRCKPNYELKTDFTCKESSMAEEFHYCLQHSDENFASLATVSACEVCNNSLDYYLDDSKVCNKKTSSKTWEGCVDTSEGNGTCLECSSEYDLVRLDQITCTGKKDDSEVTPIEHCVLYENFGKCNMCSGPGKAVSSNKSTCEDNDQTQQIYNADFSEISFTDLPDSVANCSKYLQTAADQFICIQCETNHTGVIAIQSATDFTPNELVNKFGNFAANETLYNSISECYKSSENSNKFLLRENEQMTSSDCFLAYKVAYNSKVGYCCIQFATNKSGIPALFDSPDTNDVNRKFLCISDKNNSPVLNEDTSDIVGINIESNPNKILLSNILKRANCGDGKYLMLNASPRTSGGTPFGLYFEDSTDQLTNDLQTCETGQGIDNCYLHGYVGFDSFYANTSSVKCLLCRPSFKASSDNSECTAIPNCESNGGKWLNSCSNPSHGFRVNLSGTIDHDNLHQSLGKINNCLLHKNDSMKCFICESGYKFNETSSQCEEIDLIPNCGTPGYGDFNLESMTENDLESNLSKFRPLIEIKIGNKTNSFCESCSGNKLLFSKQYSSSSGTDFVSTTKCAVKNSENQTDLAGSSSNCKVGILDDQGPAQSSECAVCNDNYTLTSSNQCILASTDANCEIFVDSSSCLKCKTGFYINSENKCTETNCSAWNKSGNWNSNLQGSCRLCPTGFKLKLNGKSVDKYTCDSMEESEKESSTCLIFSPELESCAKCKETNHQVVRFEESVISSLGLFETGVIGWRCVEKNLNDENYGNYQDNLVFSWNITHKTSSVKSAQTVEAENLNYAWDFVPIESRKLQGICLPKNPDPNCLDEETSLYCSNCATTHYLNASSGECLPNPSNCTSATSETVCTACEDTHFLNNSICEERINSNKTICKTLNLNADECSECDILNKYLDTNKICQNGTASKNCFSFKTNQDSCQSCEQGKYYLSVTEAGGVCIPYNNAVNCLNTSKYNTTKDECTECARGYWIDESVDPKQCRLVEEVPNCKSNGDETYVLNTNNCAECESGFYKFNNGEACKRYPDGINNCFSYSDSKTCIQCKPAYYLNENKCVSVPNPISDCQVHNSSTSCEKCIQNKFLKNNECIDFTATGCDTFIDDKTCDTCSANKIKDENGKNCVDSLINGCLKAIKGSTTNMCEICETGKFPSEDQTKCEDVVQPIDNCELYENSTTCKTCSSLYMLSLDKKSCVAIQNSSNINTLGSNCASGVLVSDSVCDECYPGFKFDSNGKCIQLEMNGCLVENISDSSCMLCGNTHYMDKDKKCIEISRPDNDKGIKLMNCIGIFYLLLILIASKKN